MLTSTTVFCMDKSELVQSTLYGHPHPNLLKVMTKKVKVQVIRFGCENGQQVVVVMDHLLPPAGFVCIITNTKY